MPKCGLTMREGTIVRWVRNPGDAVAEGDPVVEIETEKANMEVPAPSARVLGHLVAEIGAVVPVGGVLAVLEVPDSPDARAPVLAATPARGIVEPASTSRSTAAIHKDVQREEGVLASPFSRKIAPDLGIDIGSIRGTGPKALVTEADVRAAAVVRDLDAGPLRPSRTEPLNRMRKAIANAMCRSIAEAPQLTLTREVGIAGASTVLKEAARHVSITDVLLAAAQPAQGDLIKLVRHFEESGVA